jgi:hypothetical protein
MLSLRSKSLRVFAMTALIATITMGCSDPGAPILPPPPPPPGPVAVIGLSPAFVDWTDTTTASDPGPVVVSITNVGSAELTGLSVGTITYDSVASGWLTAVMSAPDAPTTVTLTATNGGLQPGTYTALVPMVAAGAANSPSNVTVTLTVK